MLAGLNQVDNVVRHTAGDGGDELAGGKVKKARDGVGAGAGASAGDALNETTDEGVQGVVDGGELRSGIAKVSLVESATADGAVQVAEHIIDTSDGGLDLDDVKTGEGSSSSRASNGEGSDDSSELHLERYVVVVVKNE